MSIVVHRQVARSKADYMKGNFHGSARGFIRKHIFKLPNDVLFATRELMAYGTRAAVDCAIYRLIEEGVIRRVARGVFCKSSSREFSIEEVACKKAEAFERELLSEYRVIPDMEWRGQAREKDGEAVFLTTGRPSSFLYGEVRVVFKSVGRRRFRLGSSKAATVIRNLWRLGRRCLKDIGPLESMGYLWKDDREELRRIASKSPGWLHEMVKGLRLKERDPGNRVEVILRNGPDPRPGRLPDYS